MLALTGCKFERKTIYGGVYILLDFWCKSNINISAKKIEKIWSERIPKIQKVQSRKLEKPSQRFQITAMSSNTTIVNQSMQNCTLDDLAADDLD